MKKRFLSAFLTAVLFAQSAAVSVLAESDVTVVSSDKDTSWEMNWNWERYEEGFSYMATDDDGQLQMDTAGGLNIKNFASRYSELNSVAYPTKDDGVTKSEKSGEYKMAYKTNADGEPVDFDDSSAVKINLWYHQSRANYIPSYTVNEASNNGEPIVISYDYQVINSKWDGNPNDHYWQSTYFKVLDFEMYPNTSDPNQKPNKYVIKYNNGTAKSYLALNQSGEADGWHSVKLVISPMVTNGRFQMTAIELDGNVTKLENVYSSSNGKTDADVKIDKIFAKMIMNASDRTMLYKNLVIERGIEKYRFTSDFADGGEVGDNGINIISNQELTENCLDDCISVYDENGNAISNPGTVVTYGEDMMSANLSFTNLKINGSYRFEIKNVKDKWGNENSEDFSLNFKTPTVDAVKLSTDFIDGSEITDTGIIIKSNNKLAPNAFADKVKIYDNDFDGKLIVDSGMAAEYAEDMMSASLKFNVLESGGSYKAEILGVKDIWGFETADTLTVNFRTPKEEPDKPSDDKPDKDGESEELNIGKISANSSVNLLGGHLFCKAEGDNGNYTVTVNNDEWFYANSNKTIKGDNMYWYTDRNGKEVQFGYGNESWNKMEYEIEVGETENNGNNIVVSFDYNISNGDNYEWRMPRIDIMGVMIGMPSETSETSMYGCFKNGAQIIRPKRASTSDGWHNAKLVLAPYAENNRVKAEAVIFDGEVFMLDDAYAYTANNAYATDDGVYLKTVNITVNCPSETIAKEGESVINIRNLRAERVEGLSAEIYAPNGTVSPTEDIKINFNYPVDEKINAEDILIYEADSDEPIENSISVEKKYDNRQLAVSVGDGGLYYGKEYAVVINKPLIVNEYLSSADNKYSFRTDEYPNNLTRAEFTRISDRIDYVLSSENDEYYVAAASYDEYGAMTGINIVLAKQTGSDSRRRAEGSVPISEMSKSKSVKVFVLKGDKSGIVYRLPQEFTLN